VEVVAVGYALNGLDVLAFGLDSEDEAGGDDAAVHVHGAGAAVAVITALFRAGEPDYISQALEEALPGFAEELDVFAVNGRLYVGFPGHLRRLLGPLDGGV
jgi:hypothetical protein